MNIFEEFQEALSEAVLEGHDKGSSLTEEQLKALEVKANEIVDKRISRGKRKAIQITNKVVNFAIGLGQIASGKF